MKRDFIFTHKNQLLYAVYFVLFVSLFILYLNRQFSDRIVLNFRLLFSQNEISLLQADIKNKTMDQRITTHDDPGFLILYALTSHLEGRKEIERLTNSEEFPFSLKLIQLFFHLGFIYLFVITSETILTFSTKILGLLFLVSPNLLSVFWGMDVYLFPLYASIVTLYATGELRRNELSRLKMFVCSLLIGICEIFRKNSLLVFLPFVGLVAFKKTNSVKIRSLLGLVFLVSVFLMKSLVGSVFQSHGHVVWHSLHAGLFEYGGCLGKQGEAYPFFIYDKEELAQKNLVLCQEQWNDQIQYKAAQLNGITTLYSKEYDHLLKTQIFEIVRSHPSKIASLLMMRLTNALSFVPLKEHTRAGAITKLDFTHLLESILFLTVLILWLYKDGDKERKWLLFTLLLLTLPGPLFIHSSHIIYNMPLHFIQVLIVGAFLSSSLVKFKRSGEINRHNLNSR